MAIQKDTAISNVTVNKIRKRLTNFTYDPSAQILYISFDRIAVNSSNVEVYVLDSNNSDVIPLTGPTSRAAEPLIAAFITAAQNMILNEF